MKRGPQKNERLNRVIGLRILRERSQRRLTLRVLAERAGMHVNTLDNAESGRGITLLSLCRIALALQVGLDALVPLSETIVGFGESTAPEGVNAAMVVCGTSQQLEPVASTTGEHYDSGHATRVGRRPSDSGLATAATLRPRRPQATKC